MINIDKFEALANEIITNATKNEMENWFNTYRTNQVSFVSFKPIETSFKLDFTDIKFHKNETETTINSYSFAA